MDGRVKDSRLCSNLVILYLYGVGLALGCGNFFPLPPPPPFLSAKLLLPSLSLEYLLLPSSSELCLFSRRRWDSTLLEGPVSSFRSSSTFLAALLSWWLIKASPSPSPLPTRERLCCGEENCFQKSDNKNNSNRAVYFSLCRISRRGKYLPLEVPCLPLEPQRAEPEAERAAEEDATSIVDSSAAEVLGPFRSELFRWREGQRGRRIQEWISGDILIHIRMYICE